LSVPLNPSAAFMEVRVYNVEAVKQVLYVAPWRRETPSPTLCARAFGSKLRFNIGLTGRLLLAVFHSVLVHTPYKAFFPWSCYFFGLFNLWSRSNGRPIMNDELWQTWKEVVVVYFRALLRDSACSGSGKLLTSVVVRPISEPEIWNYFIPTFGFQSQCAHIVSPRLSMLMQYS
jgi:hypothetical protein